MRHRITLGLDPSGSFKEGMGTTGWNIFDNKTLKVLDVGSVRAVEHHAPMDYWRANLNKIHEAASKYEDLAVSIENYILYGAKALSQTHSEMETSQLIGMIKLTCDDLDLDLYIRNAVVVKKRWSNEILVRKNIIVHTKLGYIIPTKPSHILSVHEIDSIRHSIHYAMFENER